MYKCESRQIASTEGLICANYDKSICELWQIAPTEIQIGADNAMCMHVNYYKMNLQTVSYTVGMQCVYMELWQIASTERHALTTNYTQRQENYVTVLIIRLKN